jgi:hypothetical protein
MSVQVHRVGHNRDIAHDDWHSPDIARHRTGQIDRDRTVDRPRGQGLACAEKQLLVQSDLRRRRGAFARNLRHGRAGRSKHDARLQERPLATGEHRNDAPVGRHPQHDVGALGPRAEIA